MNRINKSFEKSLIWWIQLKIQWNNFSKNLQRLKAFDNCKFINVGSTLGAIDTIKKSIDYITEDFINILPITTVPENKFTDKKSIYFGINLYFFDWK